MTSRDYTEDLLDMGELLQIRMHDLDGAFPSRTPLRRDVNLSERGNTDGNGVEGGEEGRERGADVGEEEGVDLGEGRGEALILEWFHC